MCGVGGNVQKTLKDGGKGAPWRETAWSTKIHNGRVSWGMGYDAERWQETPRDLTHSGLRHLGEFLPWPLGAFCFPGRERGTPI